MGVSITGKRVATVLERLKILHGLPRVITVDHGPEFTSRALDEWAYRNGVKLDFTRLGKPTDNAYIESFNGKFRLECLNQNWFASLGDDHPVSTGSLEGTNNETKSMKRQVHGLGDMGCFQLKIKATHQTQYALAELPLAANYSNYIRNPSILIWARFLYFVSSELHV